MKKMAVVVKCNQYIFCALVFLFMVTSGCVSTSKYKTLRIQRDALQKETDQLQEDNLELKAEVHKLNYNESELSKQSETRKQVMSAIIDELKEELQNKTAQVNLLEDTLKIRLLSKLFFKSGSADVNHEGRKLLARIVPALKDADGLEIRIVGHCDVRPPNAELAEKYPSNWELSTARATSIIRILQWGYGIDPKRMAAVGVAHYRPVKIINKDDVLMSNRFVEIVLAPHVK